MTAPRNQRYQAQSTRASPSPSDTPPPPMGDWSQPPSILRRSRRPMRILPHSEQGCSRCKSIEQLLETQERAIELLLESQKAITQLLRAHRGAPRTEKRLDVPPNRVIRQRIRQKRYRRRKRIREIPRERLERLERILFPTKQTMPTPSPLSARRIEELEERISKHGMQRTRELRMLEYGPVDPIRFEEAMSAIEDQ